LAFEKQKVIGGGNGKLINEAENAILKLEKIEKILKATRE